MLRLKLLVFPFGILLLLSGCIVRSLHPLYTDENVIFDTRLIGQWAEEGSKEIWEFSQQGARGIFESCGFGIERATSVS